MRQPVWDEAAIFWQPMILGIFGEQLQDPVNVGAIIRTAAALNVCALWLTPESADIYHPKVVRSMSGALLAVPIFRQECGRFDSARVVRSLRQKSEELRLFRLMRSTRRHGSWWLLLVMKVAVCRRRSAPKPRLDSRSLSAAT